MSNELIVSVTNRIQEMQQGEGLRLPTEYSVGNALNSAYLILSDNSKGKILLKKCPQTSVSKALLNMAIQGLSPAKNQCYFVPYGDQCTLMSSYFSSVSILERLSNVKKVHAEVLFEGDEFEIGSENGRTVVTHFKPSFLNRDNPIIGAFAWVEQTDGLKVYTIMTKKEIDKSWSKAKTKNVQNDYPQEMAKRTILSRAAKMYINSSNDNDLLVKSINETTQGEYANNQDRKDVTPSSPKVEKLEQELFKNTVEISREVEAQKAAKAIDLEEADKELDDDIQQEELVLKYPDPNKKDFSKEEEILDVGNETDDYPF